MNNNEYESGSIPSSPRALRDLARTWREQQEALQRLGAASADMEARVANASPGAAPATMGARALANASPGAAPATMGARRALANTSPGAAPATMGARAFANASPGAAPAAAAAAAGPSLANDAAVLLSREQESFLNICVEAARGNIAAAEQLATILLDTRHPFRKYAYNFIMIDNINRTFKNHPDNNYISRALSLINEYNNFMEDEYADSGYDRYNLSFNFGGPPDDFLLLRHEFFKKIGVRSPGALFSQNDIEYKKYLKYKQKYLTLKNSKK